MESDLSGDRSLVFAYNADSGLLNLLVDAVHRVVSPKTYPCRLCAITYSFEGMRREWKAFLRTLPFPFEFLHRDQLARKYGVAEIPLPAVFTHEEDCTELLISADQINACHSLSELKALVSKAIAVNWQPPGETDRLQTNRPPDDWSASRDSNATIMRTDDIPSKHC